METENDLKIILVKILDQVYENSKSLTEVKKKIALIESKYLMHFNETEKKTNGCNTL